MNVISLSPFDLSLAALLVLALAFISFILKLGLSNRIIIAAIRTVVQLLLIGLVLKALFAQVSLVLVTALSIFMLLIAGREVMARQQRRFGGVWGYGLGTLSMFVSSFALTIYALIAIVGTDPWYTPQYAIPLLGMMLGNTMTGVSLALDKLTTTAWQQRAVIEARLILGQDWRTAIGDITRDSVRIGMIPMINAMAAAGIVSLPGMMTGQILSGTDPVEAVKYQILIMFLITAGTGFSAMLATWIGARRLFDDRQRLRLERLS
ncbi:MAG: iron export ABC transporter permease subunit FetB [Gammaproteobacteria bacterium]|nr:iron export ABC transporter permease subunit FetB [Gammaproteobacteria bacterium]MCW8988733.1 iron export ABC transporter permease subunit FetB [Gammaproteobacteria bacterium]MCW9030824.1 iron export ABC transporter permease subunit FetB [Gammaproteobacteria bacterium]